MALIDDITVYGSAGRGGDGVVRWLHAKGKEKGGPCGGDGGRGGDVIIEGVRDLGALASYRYEKKFAGEKGENGGNTNKKGADGKPAILKVPVGTVVKNETTKESFEVLHEGEQVVVFHGGNGGRGNPHFKSSVNQNPKEATPGKAGQTGDLRFTLKIIADVGLVGFPNAGKSSLLNALTSARSKVASYPFTTLDPHLGDYFGYLIADIPGLIEGASRGRGLGSKFLRHIERTVCIAHLVSAEQEDPLASYRAIRNELETFKPNLAGKREVIVLSKSDLLSAEDAESRRAELAAATGKPVHLLSILDDAAVKALGDALVQEVSALRKEIVAEQSSKQEPAT